MEPSDNERNALKAVNEAMKELASSPNADTKKIIAARKKLVSIRGELKAMMIRADSIAEVKAMKKADA